MNETNEIPITIICSFNPYKDQLIKIVFNSNRKPPRPMSEFDQLHFF